MRAGGSKAKGSSFERVVAAEILKAAGKPFKKTDCYRTPLSGGHVFSSKESPSDLVISKRLLKRFPFAVECKNYKKLDLQHFFTGQGLFGKWIDQVTSSVTKSKVGKIHPIVVFRWNLSKTFCIVRYDTYGRFFGEVSAHHIRFRYDHVGWRVVLFSDFLARVFPL